MGEVISLKALKSARGTERRIFYCAPCGNYSFKLIETDKKVHIYCANCEERIIEFDLVSTMDID